MKTKSNLNGFFPMRAVTVSAMAVTAILTFVLASCSPIAENERMSPLQPGYGRIIVNTGDGGRAVTDADKRGARYEVFFNGVSNGSVTRKDFPVGTTVNIVVKAYRNDGTDELIGQGTASHTMTYGTTRVTVTLGPVDGSYILRFSYGEAASLQGEKSGLPEGTVYYKASEEVETPSNVTWQHGTLSGWKYNDESGEQPINGNTFNMPNTDTTLVAQWTRKQYSLTYDENIPDTASPGANVNTPTAERDKDALSTVTVGANPTLTAQNQQWTFKYWTLTAEDSDTHYSAGQEITLTDNITLYAQWTNEAVWSVTFEEPSTKPTSYTTNMPSSDVVQKGNPFSWTNPAAAGWTFEGWTVNDAGASGVPDLSATETSYTPQGDTTLTAKWTRITYTVQYFKPNGDEDTALSTTVNHGESYTINFDGMKGNLTSTQQLSGYAETNGGSATFTEQGTANIPSVTRNYTLYAVTEAKKFKVKYEPNPPNGATVMYNGAPATTPHEVERTYGQSFTWASNMFTVPNGYTWANWNTQPDGQGSTLTGTATSTYTNKTEDITVYAKWNQVGTSITINVQYLYGMGSGGQLSNWSEFMAGGHIGFNGNPKTLVLQDNTALTHTNLGIEQSYIVSGTTYTFYGLYPADKVNVDGGADVVPGMSGGPKYTTISDNGTSAKLPTANVSADMNGKEYYAVYVGAPKVTFTYDSYRIQNGQYTDSGQAMNASVTISVGETFTVDNLNINDNLYTKTSNTITLLGVSPDNITTIVGSGTLNSENLANEGFTLINQATADMSGKTYYVYIKYDD